MARPIPGSLPAPGIPRIHSDDLRELLLPAFSVFVVGFSDDVLTARAFARRGEQIDANGHCSRWAPPCTLSKFQCPRWL